MRTLILAVVCGLAATSVSLAQGGVNPGTVVSNTYDKLEARGCSQSFGFSPPGCNYGRLAARPSSRSPKATVASRNGITK